MAQTPPGMKVCAGCSSVCAYKANWTIGLNMHEYHLALACQHCAERVTLKMSSG